MVHQPEVDRAQWFVVVGGGQGDTYKAYRLIELMVPAMRYFGWDWGCMETCLDTWGWHC